MLLKLCAGSPQGCVAGGRSMLTSLAHAAVRCRPKTQDPPLILVGEKVDEAVWTLNHMPDALTRRDALLAGNTCPRERQADQQLRGQPGQQETAAPVREGRTTVEGDPGERDRGCPVADGI